MADLTTSELKGLSDERLSEHHVNGIFSTDDSISDTLKSVSEDGPVHQPFIASSVHSADHVEVNSLTDQQTFTTSSQFTEDRSDKDFVYEASDIGEPALNRCDISHKKENSPNEEKLEDVKIEPPCHNSNLDSANNMLEAESHIKDSSSANSVLTNGVVESVKENDIIDECLESEQKSEWMDIFNNGELKKKILKAGLTDSRPPSGSLVTVKVQGRLETGTCFQDTKETFILGDGDAIAAIDLAVALMNVQEVAEIITKERFGYGAKGMEPNIPANATLYFTLELLDVQPGPDISKLTAEERLGFGEKKRERGNELFTRQDYSGAINSYSKAVKYLDGANGGLVGDTSVLQHLLDCKIKCYNNLAASQLKIHALDATVRSCKEVLKHQPDNVKALYRLGKAHSLSGHTQKAITVLKKAIKLDPESKMLHRELAWLTKQSKQEVESEKNMYKRMLGNLSDSESDKKNKKSNSSNMLWWTLLTGGVVAAAISVGLAYFRLGH